jgi:hypothetical protein
MLKRIAPIACLTGAGQLLSIFALKYLSLHGQSDQLQAVGQTDSLVQFIVNVIALGLQSVSMRNIALADDWKDEYKRTQSARTALACLLMGGALLAFVNKYYLLFLITPLFAWNGDYTLYAVGQPVKGAIVAFTRVLIPYSMLVLTARYGASTSAGAYIAGVFLAYLMTNLYIARFLQVSFFTPPRFKDLILYLRSLPLGIVILSLYFTGLGLLMVVPYFYSDVVTAVVFVGLKFYVIYKGVLRILQQAFIKDMIADEVRFKVDQISIMLALAFAGSALIFPKSFILLFFGEKYLDYAAFFHLLALGALIYSVLESLGVKALLNKKDKVFMQVSIAAALTTIIATITLSYFWPKPTSVGISLCAGELVWLIGLIDIAGTAAEVRSRMAFLATTLPTLALPVILRYFMDDGYIAYFSSFGLFGLLLVALHFQKFKSFTKL